MGSTMINDFIKNQKNKLKVLISNKSIDLIRNGSFLIDKNKAYFILKEYLEDGKKDTTLEYRKKPDDFSLELSKIRLIIPFEAEEFYKIRQIIKNLFPNTETINKLLSSIEKEEPSLNTLNWRNIGLLSRKSTQSFGLMYNVDHLPEYCDMINVSYTRITSSISILSFEFSIQKDFSSVIANVQNKKLEKKVIFNKLFPFHFKAFKLSLQYGFSTIRESSATKYVREEINFLKSNFQNWLYDKTKTILSDIGSLDIFTINAKSQEDFELHAVVNKNHQWLHDYGISYSYMEKFYNEKICYTGRVDKVTESEDAEEYITITKNFDDESYYEIESTMDGLSVYIAFQLIFKKLSSRIEKQKLIGFNKIMKPKMLLLNSGNDIFNLHRISLSTERLATEIEKAEHWIRHMMESLMPLMDDKKQNNLYDILVQNIKLESNELKIISQDIESGLSKYLSSENIIATYKLQKQMRFLTWVAAVVGILSFLGLSNIIQFFDCCDDFDKIGNSIHELAQTKK